MSEVIDWSAIERRVLVSQKLKAGLRAEDLRERMDPEPIVRQLLHLVNEADRTPIEDLPRLKLKADILNGILKKVMPDLRSLEVTERDNKHSTLIIQMEPSVRSD